MIEQTELRRKFQFEAAHSLPNAPVGHRCRSIHGHSYIVEVRVQGDIDPHAGWVIDFAEIDEVVNPVVERLDHSYLNEIDGLENPTSELLARWLWTNLHDRLPGLSEIVVSETIDSVCSYKGTDRNG